MDTDYFGVCRTPQDLGVALKSKIFQVIHASHKLATDHFRMTSADWEQFIATALTEAKDAWADAVELRNGQRATVNDDQGVEAKQHKKRKGDGT